MRRTYTTLIALLLLAAAPAALAGIRYTAVTSTEGGGGNQETTVDAWVDGAAAKVVFRESATPMLEEGSYVVTKDGGKTLYLVNPKEKTYAEWNLDAMLQMVGNMMQAMGPMLNFQVDNVEVKELGSGPGPAMHGLATTHAKFHTTYDMKIKVLGMGRTNHVESDQEIWSTQELGDPALGIWLRKEQPTGFGELDKLVKAEMDKVQGFPLKSVTRTTTTGQKGKREQTTVSTMEVTELDRSASIPASTFEIPEGYTQSEAMVPQQEGEQKEDKNPFPSCSAAARGRPHPAGPGRPAGRRGAGGGVQVCRQMIPRSPHLLRSHRRFAGCLLQREQSRLQVSAEHPVTHCNKRA